MSSTRTDTASKPLAKIVVVEDSRIQSKLLADRLMEAGYSVTTAENGQVGLEAIREHSPDLVISDIEMPKMTGYELCREVKNHADLKSIPFILLSTLSDPQDIIKGLHCGADNYVTKPYDPTYLIGRVESLLSSPIVGVEEDDEQELAVTLGGVEYRVKAGRQQVLNLLVSTFENAVEKNNELARSNEELTLAKEQLTRWNEKLESLNSQLENANNRMSRDLEAAAQVQQSLLPSKSPETDRVRFSWKYLPCDELAGDFLNFFALDERHIAVYMVDVSGHGVASSLLSVTIGRLLTAQVSASSVLVRPGENGKPVIVPPAEVAYELNQRFQMEEMNGLSFTMAYGVLDTESLEFRFVCAGHDPLVRAPLGGPPEIIDGGGMVIGWVADMEFDDQVVQLHPGDRLFIYSDGVPEAMDANMEQFTLNQMLEIMELGQARSLEESVGLLSDTVERWCRKNGPKDDVSILGIEIPKDIA